MDYLVPPHVVDQHVTSWLHEDSPSLDYTGYVIGDATGSARILCKSPGVLCGRPFVDAVFARLSCSIVWSFNEGDALQPICTVAEVTGKIKNILLGERVALNVLSRASGVASACRRLAEKKKSLGWDGDVAGTRKTTPGFRVVEKYALLVGGCAGHRYDLSSMVMLKDNHLWSVGDTATCVTKARAACGFSTKIEVECRSIEEALAAGAAGADVVMLDNFAAGITEDAAKQIKAVHSHLLIEVSGGVTENNIAEYMTPSVDVISSSSLTQGYACVDFSLKIVKEGRDLSNPLVKDIKNSVATV